MSSIAIIPARSGSKGYKDKNITDLLGKPLLAWSIEAALKSGVFDEVMVSTDSEKYAKIAMEYGAAVPFLRSEENASDMASSWDVMREVLRRYSQQGREFDVFCLLQPTSPLRDCNDIRNAIDIFYSRKADSVISVCPMNHSLRICNVLPDDMNMNGFFDSTVSGRRQDEQKYYMINGAIYIQKVSELMKCHNIYGENSYAYVMTKANSVDIDDRYDFLTAESYLREKLETCNG